MSAPTADEALLVKGLRDMEDQNGMHPTLEIFLDHLGMRSYRAEPWAALEVARGLQAARTKGLVDTWVDERTQDEHYRLTLQGWQAQL